MIQKNFSSNSSFIETSRFPGCFSTLSNGQIIYREVTKKFQKQPRFIQELVAERREGLPNTETADLGPGGQ